MAKTTLATSGRKREPLSNATLLMLISIAVFIAMYIYAINECPKGNFNKPRVFLDILNGNAPLIIIGCALTIVMIGGGINISVGGVIGLTAMSCVLFMNSGMVEDGPWTVVLTAALAVGIGLAFGLLMGFMISYLKIQPFIVTLAGMVLARGLTTVQSAINQNIASKAFKSIKTPETDINVDFLGSTNKNGYFQPGRIEIGVVIALVILVLVFLMLRYTKFGRNIYAIGGNEQSAMMLGINVKRNRFISYVISGVLSGIAGFVYILHNGGVSPSNVAVRSEMDAIASSIIGGTLLSGGVGNVFGTFFGVLILSTIEKIIKFIEITDPALKEVFSKYQADIQNIANGALLGLFIVIQSIVLSIRSKGKIRFHLPPWLKFGNAKKPENDKAAPPASEGIAKA